MTNHSQIERDLENLIYPGFPDDADERADIIRQIIAVIEQALPRACQSSDHSPFECWYGSYERVWRCSGCRQWFCRVDALDHSNRCTGRELHGRKKNNNH